MAKKILFVCTGNTCRSSMAEHLFRRFVQEVGRDGEFIIRSAGVAAFPNDPASAHAVEVLYGKGIDSIGAHQATPVNDELIREADVILTMTQAHKAALIQRYPGNEGKIFCLKEYTFFPEEKEADLSLDVKDPYGGSLEIYQACARELEEHLRRLLKLL